MSKVTLLNTLPRPHSVPYVLVQPEQSSNTISATSWLQIMPGISLEIEDYIWERVKEHPDVKHYLEQRTLFIVKADIAQDTEKFNQIEALVSGELVNLLDQPVPIATAKTLSTNSPIDTSTETGESTTKTDKSDKSTVDTKEAPKK